MTERVTAAGARVHLRSADPGDARLLFEWLNHADSLAGSLLTTDPVPWGTHKAWFEERLFAAHCGIWIAELAGAPIGQVRAERGSDGNLYVSIFVIAEARKRGIGAAMLELLTEASAVRWPGEPLAARIQNGNSQSRRLFEANGYCFAESYADHCVYVRTSLV